MRLYTRSLDFARGDAMGARLRLWWQKIKSRLVVVRWHWLSLWKKIKQHPYATGVVVLLVLILFIFLAYKFGWDWTGFNSGTSQITVTSTSKGNYTATISQPSKSLWDWLLLGSSIATTLAIIAAGWWFYKSRSLAGTLQITLTLTGVTMVKNTRVAIVRVQIKNVGRTRVKKYYCISVAEVVKVGSYSKPVNIIPAGSLINFESQYSRKRNIFTSQTEIEPNEELFEDIVLVQNETAPFAVGVQLKGKGTREAWSAFAVFNVDDKANVPTPTDFSTIENVKNFPH